MSQYFFLTTFQDDLGILGRKGGELYLLESILTSIKKMLGIEEDYEAFDTDIIIHINTVFTILHQLGVGPKEVFKIHDKYSYWSDFIETGSAESVKTYIYMRVRLLFDPPTSSIANEALKDSIKELEFRLNVSEDDTY